METDNSKPSPSSASPSTRSYLPPLLAVVTAVGPYTAGTTSHRPQAASALTPKVVGSGGGGGPSRGLGASNGLPALRRRVHFGPALACDQQKPPQVVPLGFFKAMLSSGLREAQSGVVDLSEHEFASAVLRFVYTGALPVLSDQELGQVWRAAHFLDSSKALLAAEVMVEQRCAWLADGTVFVVIAGPPSVVDTSKAWGSATAALCATSTPTPNSLSICLWCLALCTRHATVTAPSILRVLLKQQAAQQAVPVAALMQKIGVGTIGRAVALSRGTRRAPRGFAAARGARGGDSDNSG
jgi:hypothetical protein